MPARLARYCEGVMEAAWLWALILTPLFFNIYSSRVFEPDKAVILRSLALLALAAWLGKALGGLPTWRGARLSFGTVAGFLRVPLVAPVLALGVVYVISTLLSVAPQTSLSGSYPRLQGTLTTFAYLALFATAATHLRRRAQVERLLAAAMLTSLPVSLYGILQRFHLDPLPWGADISTHVTSSLGNATFLGAYLILVVPVILGKLIQVLYTLKAERPAGSLLGHWLRLVIYLALLGLDLTALAFTGSFTPWLGLAAGLLFFGAMLAFIWRSRALSVAVAACVILSIAGVVIFNVAYPEDGGGGQVTQRVRVLISQGVTAMMKSPAPLEYPDGHADPWADLRPLVGYGPETFYVAFNRFFPPELGWQAMRGASPDRAYNETLDALATTGWLGVAAYLALFSAAFYAAFKGLGMMAAPGRSTLFWGLALGGVTAGAAAYGGWQGPEAVGLGLAFGLAAGMGTFAVVCTWRAVKQPPEASGSSEVGTARESWRAIFLASVGAVIMAHLVEINLGIAITPTRTYFWLLLAALCMLSVAPDSILTPATSESAAEPQPPTQAEMPVTRKPWQPVLASAGVTTVLLMILGFDFVTNPTASTQPIQISIETLTAKSGAFSPSHGPYGILVLALVTWIVGGVLAYLEEASLGSSRLSWTAAGISLGLGLAIGVGFWSLLGWQHAAVAALHPNSIETLSNSVARIVNFPISLCVALLLLAGAWAVGLPAEWPPSRPWHLWSVAASVGGGVLLMGALVASAGLSLSVIRADIFFKTAAQFDQQGQPDVAIPLLQQALRFAPEQDYYYMFLGSAYLNQAKKQGTPAAQAASLAQAEAALKTAQRLNPLNTDHTANLARLYRQWALLASSPADRQKLIGQADANYATAVKLSPNNVLLWNEWADFSLQLRGAPDAAQTELDHSLALDTTLGQTYQIQGDIYVWRANQAADAAERKGYAERAIQAYQTGLNRGDEAGLHVGLAQAYEVEGLYPMAVEQLQRAIQMTLPGSPDLWQLYRQLGGVYEKAGDTSQARVYGQKALDLAPAASRAEIEAWLKTLP